MLKRGGSRASIFFLLLALIVVVGVIRAANESQDSSLLVQDSNNSINDSLPIVINDAVNQTGQLNITVNQTADNATQQNTAGQSNDTFSSPANPVLPQLPLQELNESLTPAQNVTPAENQTTNTTLETLDSGINETPNLAKIVHGISTDTPYIQNYLEIYKNFSEIEYKKVRVNSKTEARLIVGAKEENVQGFELNKTRYVIHLILCNHNTKECAFRINGVPTGGLAAKDNAEAAAPQSFDFDENTTLQINSIQLDYCDGRRFCNVHHEAYDIVNVTVITQ